MNIFTVQVGNQDGFMIVVALLVLTLLSIIGIAGISTSNTEQQIAGYEEIYKMAFYAAEAGRAYVVQNPELYHDDNLDDGEAKYFPDPNDISADFYLSDLQSFKGTVSYQGSSMLPRGSGFEAGDFKAHNYVIVSNGQGPRQSVTQIEEGFYRIGF